MNNNSFFNHVIYFFTDLLFPKSETVKKLEKDSTVSSPADFLKSIRVDFEDIENGIYSIFPYKNEMVRELIWEIKYKRNKILIHKAAELIYEKICSLGLENYLIIPVPQHRLYVRQKGFNQSKDLVEAIEKFDGRHRRFQYSYNLVQKMKKTKKQNKTSGRTERLNNLRGAFSCADIGVEICAEIGPKTDPVPRHNLQIIIIDDVYTTGSTILEMKKCIRKQNPNFSIKIIGITLAH